VHGAADNQHSKEFREYMGTANLQDPGSPSEVDVFFLQRALFEIKCWDSGNVGIKLPWVPNSARFAPGLNNRTSDPVGQHHTRYSLDELRLEEPIRTYLELAQYVKNLNEHELIEGIAERQLISYAHLFLPDNSEPKQPHIVSPHFVYQLRRTPTEIMVRSSLYRANLSDFQKYLFDHNNISADITSFVIRKNSISFCLIHYRNNDGLEIQLPVTIRTAEEQQPAANGVVNLHYLAPGLDLSQLSLLHPYMIETMHEDADTVFLCEDLRVAKKLNALILDSKRFIDRKFIATSWYGGRRLIQKVNFSSLWDKNIVYIPAVNRGSFDSAAYQIKAKCDEVKVRSFKIQNRAVLCYPLAHEDISQADGLADPWERSLAKAAIDIDKQESFILKELTDTALPIEKYKAWSEDIGLIEASFDPEEKRFKAKYSSLASLRQNAPLGDSRLTLTTACFGDYDNISIIYGDRASGKSMLALGLTCARACGLDFFGFTPLSPTKVLFIDGETAAGVFHERLERTITALKCDQSQLEKNLELRLIYAERLPNIDFNDDAIRKSYEQIIHRNHIKLVVFDNLMSLLPGFSHSNSAAAWQSFWQWILQLERKYQLGIVLLHHSNNDNQVFGTRNIERQCSSVVHVTGGDQLKQKVKNSKHEEYGIFDKYTESNGALLQVEFSKCKLYSSKIKPFGAYLERFPDNPADPLAATKGPPWKLIGPPLASHQPLDPEAEFTQNFKLRFPDLTEEALVVVKLLSGGERLSRQKVQENLRCGKGPALKIINDLTERRILDKIGKARAREYQLRAEYWTD